MLGTRAAHRDKVAADMLGTRAAHQARLTGFWVFMGAGLAAKRKRPATKPDVFLYLTGQRGTETRCSRTLYQNRPAK